MIKLILRGCVISFISLALLACASVHKAPPSPTGYQPKSGYYLLPGKRDFEAGYYKRAMHELLPLACDGSPEAQYAVGFMYYYGYGVTQDTDVGYFWIKRSADQGYAPAQKALDLIVSKKAS